MDALVLGALNTFQAIQDQNFINQLSAGAANSTFATNNSILAQTFNTQNAVVNVLEDALNNATQVAESKTKQQGDKEVQGTN